jgi:hypothetical protein
MTRRLSFAGFAVAALLVALALAFFVSPHASSKPDGLEKVAADHRLDSGQSAPAGRPLAGYSVQSVHDSGLSTGLAGVVGVIATFAVGAGLFVVIKRVRS